MTLSDLCDLDRPWKMCEKPNFQGKIEHLNGNYYRWNYKFSIMV
jgi:hypothetical protein